MLESFGSDLMFRPLRIFDLIMQKKTFWPRSCDACWQRGPRAQEKFDSLKRQHHAQLNTFVSLRMVDAALARSAAGIVVGSRSESPQFGTPLNRGVGDDHLW